MKRWIQVACALLVSYATYIESYYSSADCRWRPHFVGEGWIGGFRNGGGVGAWAPVSQSGNRLVYVQGLGGRFIDQPVGGLGVGYRQACGRNLGFGINAFGDVSRSLARHVYLQGGFGAELFGACWDARINGYFPTRHQSIVGVDTSVALCSLDGTEAVVCRHHKKRLEQAYTGLDVEAGYGLCFGRGELWGHAGYYYYGARSVNRIHGPRLRLEYRVPNLFGYEGLETWAGVEYQYDRLHRSDTTVRLGIRIPLGCCRRTTPCCRMSICRQMGRRAERQPAPWVLRDYQRGFTESFENLLLLFAAGDSTPPGGLGTQPDPLQLPAALVAAGPGDVIVVLNDYGAFTIGSTIPLQPDEQIVGFLNNPSLTVTLSDGAVVTVPNLNNSGPAVFDAGVGSGIDIFALDANNQLNGFHTEGGGSAIIGGGSGCTIGSLLINNPQVGIDITGGADLAVNDVTISAAAGAGISLNTLFNVSVSNCTIENGNTGLLLTNNSGTFGFSNNTIQGNLGAAVDFSGGTATCNFTGNTISAPAGAALVNINAGANIIDFSGGSLSNVGGTGIQVNGTTGGSASFANVTISAPTTAAVTLANCTGAVSLTNAVLSTTGQTGLDIDAQIGPVTVGGTLTQNGGGTAIDVAGGSSTINCSGLTIDNTGAAIGLSVQNTTAGSVTCGPTTLTNPVVGIRLNGNTGGFTCNSLAATAAAASTGLDIDAQVGPVTVGGTLTQNGGGTAIDVDGGSSTINCSGLTVGNTGAAIGLSVQNTTAGSVTCGPTTLTNPALAIRLNGNTGAFTCNSLAATAAAASTGLDIDAQVGPVTVGGTLTQNGGGTAIDVDGGSSTINCSGLTVDNTGAAIGLSVQNTTAGSVTCGPTTLTNPALAIRLNGNTGGFTCNSLAATAAAAMTGLDIDAQAGAVTVGGTLTQNGGGTAIDVAGGSSTINCLGLTVDNTGAAIGLSVQNTTAGSVTCGPTTLTNPALAIRLNGNTGGFTCSSLAATAAAASTGLDIDAQVGPVTVGGTLTQNGGGTAIDINLGSAAYDFSGLTISNTGSSATPIIIGGTTGGSVIFGPITATGVTATNGVSLTGNTAPVRFANLAITGSSGGTLFASGQAGALRVDTGSIDVTGGPAVSLTNTVVDASGLTFTNLQSASSGTQGILLDTVTGGSIISSGALINAAVGSSISIQNCSNTLTLGTVGAAATAAITNPSGHVFDITNGSPTLNYYGSVSGAGSRLANITGTTGGSVLLNGLETGASQAITQNGGTGIFFDSCAGPLSVLGASLSNQSSTHATFSNSSGNVVLSSVSCDSAGTNGIVVDTNTGSFTTTGLSIANTPLNAIEITGNSGVSLCTTTTLTDPGTGIHLNANTGSVTFNAFDMTAAAASTGLDIDAQEGTVTVGGTLTQNGGGTAIDVNGGSSVINCSGLTVDNTGAAIGLSVQNTTAGSVTCGSTTLTNPALAIRLNGNTGGFTCNSLAATAAAAMTGLDIDGQIGPVTVGGTLTQNGGGTAIDVNLGSAVCDFSGLTISNTGSSVAPIVVGGTTGGSIISGPVTATGVTATNGVSLTSNAAPVRFTNLAITGTNGGTFLTNGQSGDLRVDAGSIDVTGVPALSLLNSTVDAAGMVFSSLQCSGSSTQGISLNAVSGGAISATSAVITNAVSSSILMQDCSNALTLGTPGAALASITGGSGGAFNIQNGSPTLNYYGSVSGTSGQLVAVNATTGGSVLLDGRDAGASKLITKNGGTAISCTSCAGNFSLLGASLTNQTGSHASFSSCSGNMTLDSISGDSPGSDGVVVTGSSGVLTANNLDLQGLSGVHGMNILDQSGNISITNSNFVSKQLVTLTSNAVQIVNSVNPSNIDITFTNNDYTVVAVLGLAPAYIFAQTGGNGTMNIGISGNSSNHLITGAGIHFVRNTGETINIIPPPTTRANVNAQNPGMAVPATSSGSNPIP